MTQEPSPNENAALAPEGRCRVVIVDDHGIVRAGLRTVLGDSPRLEVVGEAENAAVAIQVCGELRPDVVLLDMRLPDRSGVEVCLELKRTMPGIRVLFLTSYGDDANVMAGLAAGADGYLLKTITGCDIADAVLKVAAGGAVLDPLVTRQLVGAVQAPVRREPALHILSERERAILDGVVRGLLNKEIAAEGGVSEKTIRNQLTQIYEKLGVKTRAEAAILFEKLRRNRA